MSRSISSRIALAAASVGVLGLVSAAHATLIAYEGFTGDTPGITLSAQPSSDGTGWGGGWQDFETSNGVYGPDGTVVNQNLQYNGNSFGNAAQLAQSGGVNPYDFRPLASALPAAGGATYYFSFLVGGVGSTGNNVNLLSLYSGATPPTYASGGSSPVNDGAIAQFGSVNNTGDFGISYTNATNQNIIDASAVAPSSSSTTTLLVLEVSYGSTPGTDSVNLFINPTGSNPTAALTLSDITLYSSGSSSATADQPISFLRLGSNSTTDGYFDEVRVGSTLADVVPEPSTPAMLAIPGLALLGRRRRAERGL